MKVPIVWSYDLFSLLEEMSAEQREAILERIDLLAHFPHLYPVRTRGRFRGHRWFVAGDWIVYYKFVEGTIHIRGMWPARIP